MSEVHVSVAEIAGFMEGLEDPRSEINQKHPLVSVVVITIMAVLAGPSGPTGSAQWAQLQGDLASPVSRPTQRLPPQGRLSIGVGVAQASRLSSLFHELAPGAASPGGGR